MNEPRFDTVLKMIGTATSRRQALAGLLGGALTLFGEAGAEAGPAAGGVCKPKCSQCKKCQKGRCRPKRNGTQCGRGRACQGGRCVQRKCGEGGPCRVFVTSSEHNGNLGGLRGADRICQRLAERAGLPGRYFAWLSDSVQSPSTDFSNLANTGPYVLVNGTKIANSWQDLTDGSLAAPINRTEQGEVEAIVGIWTNTRAQDGGATSETPATTCDNWTSASGTFTGGFGYSSFTDEGWMEDAFSACDFTSHLYCFEQG